MPSSVSVVIPVRNGAAFVAEAIDSVLAQEGFACEVIVVDNASTDGTAELVEQRYGSRVVLVEEPRLSAAHARNTGARVAAGEWLAFLDADDVWLPGKLQRQMEAWDAQPEIDILFTMGEEFPAPGMDAAQRAMYVCRTEPYPMVAPPSFLARRETFRRVGDFPALPSGEFIAWMGWARELGLRELVVPEVLVRRRIHPHNSTRNGSVAAGYPLAVRWLLEKRRQHAASGGRA